MAERRYPLAQAAADLRAAGLLDGWFAAARGGRWSRHAADDPAPAGAFLGAALDSRALPAGALFVGLAGDRTDGRHYVDGALRNGAGAALTRPHDGPGPDPLLSGDAGGEAVILLSRDPQAALTLLADRWRTRLATPAVAVTGSNGKTTTKDLLACLLATSGPTHATAGNFNNDLGLPLTLLGLRESHRWAVLELGASAPGDIDRLARLARPRVGVITNAAGAHLEGFGGLEGVVRTKGELLDHLPADGAAVLDRDHHAYAAWRDRAPCPVLDWGESAGPRRWSWEPDARGGRVTLDGETWVLPLPGRHNGANLAAAATAARALSGEALDIAVALTQFRGSPHRNRVLDAAGVTVLDDTYNANPESVLAAARGLADLPGDGRRLAALGAMAELGPRAADLHRETGAALRALGLDGLWVVGEAARPLAEGFGAHARWLPDVDAAAADAADAARPGDRLLVKGSRSAGMERFVDRFLARRNPDLSNLESR
ncbi:MAG TPA: UDP-N-acetylmuramoyl-tripeptide--D-alanyl-D-alanine ligase [Candidatus Krumholzibacteria bacterium]|nr:UDP-N-acetylmuramoyl-tripeptide--D-alanyl-D-alanine ligase [Candidatus Krumholzibacteria bacterium]